MGAKSNWWSPGDNGPCGPDTEMFYDVSGKNISGLTKDEFLSADERQEVVEIWNDVFMEYDKKNGMVIGKLQNKNVDTGSGLERVVCVVQGKDNVYDTDLFTSVFSKINELSTQGDLRSTRIIADHTRSSVFLIADGVAPSNTDQGYILRRLIRRSIRYADKIGMSSGSLKSLVPVIVEKYIDSYPELHLQCERIICEIDNEELRFRKTLEKGIREFEKISSADISGSDAFLLFSTYGFPFELTKELADEKGVVVDEADFLSHMEAHQTLSRTGAVGRFKGGLASLNEKTTMLHTVTHLMLAGLKKYLGSDIHQAGSNITEERTRFDFTHGEKVDRSVLDQVEAYVNEAVSKKCEVTLTVMDKEVARASGVEGSFWAKYPDKVNVYMVVSADGTIYSRELCGGPHVKNTADIHGVFKIKKEEASSAGVRRIKAVLE